MAVVIATLVHHVEQTIFRLSGRSVIQNTAYCVQRFLAKMSIA